MFETTRNRFAPLLRSGFNPGAGPGYETEPVEPDVAMPSDASNVKRALVTGADYSGADEPRTSRESYEHRPRGLLHPNRRPTHSTRFLTNAVLTA
jgi:hypothetical protein